MKKIIITILSIIMVCCVSTFTLVACGGDDNKVGTYTQPEKEITLSLSESQKNLVIGDVQNLIASHSVVVGQTVSWTSSNPEVASVSATGAVTANKQGSTVITASFGGKTATCEVTVSLGGYAPVIVFENLMNNNSVTCANNSSVNVAARVAFNGKVFDDGVFTYEVEDPSVGTIETVEGAQTGKFNALSKGETQVAISGTWRGIETTTLKTVVNVKVVTSNIILIDEGATAGFELWTAESFALGGQSGLATSSNLTGRITATSDGEDKLNDPSFSLTLKSNVANDGVGEAVSLNTATKTITKLSSGSAVLEISFNDVDGIKFTKEFPISVLRPTADLGQKAEFFSQADGDIDYNSILGNSNFVSAFQNGDERTGRELTLQDKKITDLSLSKLDGVSNETIYVYDDTYGYKVAVEAYAKVIKTTKDLHYFDLTAARPIVTGYVVLANDIYNAGDFEPDHSAMKNNCGWDNTSVGYKAQFDGLGHTIYGLNLISGTGIFGQVQTDSSIKNFALVDTTLTYKAHGYSNEDAATLLYSLSKNNAKKFYVENCYFNITHLLNYTTYAAGLLLRPAYENIINVVVEYNDTLNIPETHYGRGSLCAGGTGASTFSNVVVLSDAPLMSYYAGSTKRQTLGVNHKGEEQWGTLTSASTSYRTKDGYTTYFCEGTYSYLDRAEMQADSKNTADLLDSFNPLYWDTTSGVPVWLGSQYEITVNGVKSNVANLVNSESTGVGEVQVADINVQGVNGATITDVVVSLREIEPAITLSGKTVTAIQNKLSNTFVNVSFNVNGTAVNTVVLVNVVKSTLQEKLVFSTVDKKMIVQNGIELANVKSILNRSETVTYFDGTNTDASLNNLTNNPKEFEAIINLKSGESFYGTIVSYTGAVSKTQDFRMFDLNEETKIITGCFALINNIDNAGDLEMDHSAMAGNRSWNNTTVGFDGTFDGMGHYVEGLNIIGQSGIFGQAQANAVIKNLALPNLKLTYKNQSLDGDNKAAPILFLELMNNGKNAYVSNVYAEVNDESNTSASSYGIVLVKASSWLHISNVVLIYNVTQTIPVGYPEKNCWGIGSMYFTSGDTYQYNKASGVMSISILPIVMRSYESSSVVNYAIWGMNRKDEIELGTTLETTTNGVPFRTDATGRKHYFWEGHLTYNTTVDAMADKSNNTEFLATFDDSIWDTSSGIPVFNSIPNPS